MTTARFQVLAEDLGCATGLGFSPTGDLVIGDRDGTLYRVDSENDVSVFSHLRASVSAYHLAFNSSGYLFVSGPTLSSRDQIVEFRPDGAPCRVHSGFGRPQASRSMTAIAVSWPRGSPATPVSSFYSDRSAAGDRRAAARGGGPQRGPHAGGATSDAIYEFDLDSPFLRGFADEEPEDRAWSEGRTQ